MKVEYDAIYQAGLVLQLDCPDLACDWVRGERRTIGEFRRTVAQRLEAPIMRRATSRARRCGRLSR
jgi:hypothetical protein